MSLLSDVFLDIGAMTFYFDGNEYSIHANLLNQSDAQLRCKSLEDHLVEIEYIEEWNAIAGPVTRIKIVHNLNWRITMFS